MNATPLSDYINEQFVGEELNREKIMEAIYKSAKDGWNDKLGYVPLKPMALITVHDPDSSVIESVGFSEPNDILTDNFGVYLSQAIAGGHVIKNMVDWNGLTDSFRGIGSNLGMWRREDSPFVSSVGSYMQIGRNEPAGGGAAGNFARSDFQLNYPFVVVPEANLFSNSPGGWISGNQQVIINGLLSGVVSSDTIGECGLYCQWWAANTSTAGVSRICLLSHDLAGASFVGGQNVNVTYTWSIT